MLRLNENCVACPPLDTSWETVVMEASPAQLALHEIKGVLTKFMRMLYPYEFRIDSLTNFGAALAFRFPLSAGEVIYLPEKVEDFADRETAFAYYKVIAAHLAGRHEFGTFELKLADLPGFEDRGETGVEAIDAYISAFSDPRLAGALMRLCEAARVDAALARRYRGLTRQISIVNRDLALRSRPGALGTMLIRAALGLSAKGVSEAGSPLARAAALFALVRNEGADVRLSALVAAALF